MSNIKSKIFVVKLSEKKRYFLEIAFNFTDFFYNYLFIKEIKVS